MRGSVPAQPQRRGSLMRVLLRAELSPMANRRHTPRCGVRVCRADGPKAMKRTPESLPAVKLEPSPPARQNAPVVPWLRFSSLFPPIDAALDDPNGLLAAGGDLSPERLRDAYRHGIFPWYNGGQPILWWSPNPRMVLFVDEFKLPRSLGKVVRQGRFEIRVDTAFRQVVGACAGPRHGQSGTWISPQVIDAYTALHEQGHAHSV